MVSNFVTLTGNLCFEPVMRYTSNDYQIAQNRIAVFAKKDSDGNNISFFFDIKGWNQQADNIAELAKGTRVTLTGKLTQESWDDADGKKRDKTVVQIDSIVASPWEDRGSTQRSAPAEPPAQPRSAAATAGFTTRPTETPDYDDIPF